AGIRALRMLADVLRAPGDPAAAQPLGRLREIRKRHAHRAVRGTFLDERIQERGVGSPAAMHFPVAGNQPHTRHAPEFYRTEASLPFGPLARPQTSATIASLDVPLVAQAWRKPT